MRPLKTAQNVMLALCLFPPDSSISFWKKMVYIVFAIGVILSQIITCAALLAFIYKNVQINFVKTLFAFCTLICASVMTYIAWIGFLLRREIYIIFESLDEIYDTSKAIFKTR